MVIDGRSPERESTQMSISIVYHCKKNGRDYVYTAGPNTVLASPRDEYAWRKGTKEYADNYHASVGTPGTGSKNAYKIETSKDVFRDATMDEYRAKIDAMCDEAHARFHADDLPGEKAPADPRAVAIKSFVAELMAEGKTLDEIKAVFAKPSTESVGSDSKLIPAPKVRKTA
jgi:hypothetical protein